MHTPQSQGTSLMSLFLVSLAREGGVNATIFVPNNGDRFLRVNIVHKSRPRGW